MRRHRAVEWTTDNRRECRVCGRLVIGIGPTLRHYGEEVTVIVPRREDARAFDAAVIAGERAVENLPRDATADDYVRAVVQAVYATGYLRQRRGDRPVPEPAPERPPFRSWYEPADRDLAPA